MKSLNCNNKKSRQLRNKGNTKNHSSSNIQQILLFEDEPNFKEKKDTRCIKLKIKRRHIKPPPAAANFLENMWLWYFLCAACAHAYPKSRRQRWCAGISVNEFLMSKRAQKNVVNILQLHERVRKTLRLPLRQKKIGSDWDLSLWCMYTCRHFCNVSKEAAKTNESQWIIQKWNCSNLPKICRIRKHMYTHDCMYVLRSAQA